MDVLTDLLQRSRARGAAFAHTTVRGDSGVRFPAGPRISVHAIVAGEAHLWADAPEDATRLAPGDIASCASPSTTAWPTCRERRASPFTISR